MVNFKVVSGEDVWLKYHDFVELYNNPDILVKDIRSRLGLSSQGYIRFRDEAIRCGDVAPRGYNRRKSRPVNPRRFVQRSMGLGWRIKYKGEYFGTYRDVPTAIRVRDLLIECDWDKSQLDRIKKEVMM